MIRMGRLLTMSIIALFSAGVKGTSPSPPPPPGYPPALPSDVPQLPPLPPPPIPSLPPIPPGQPTWHLGARGQSCTAVCSGEGKVCDSLTIATITSAALITKVAALAGGCALPRRAPVGRTLISFIFGRAPSQDLHVHGGMGLRLQPGDLYEHWLLWRHLCGRLRAWIACRAGATRQLRHNQHRLLPPLRLCAPPATF